MSALDFDKVFRGTPPARDSVYLLRQKVGFTKLHWLPQLPDPAFWPPELETGTVDRHTVFQIARRADDELGAVHTLVAASVWTSGPKQRGAIKLGMVFGHNPDMVGPNLAAAVRATREDGPLAGFAMLTRKGSHALGRLPGSGFTKVLYFAAFDGKKGPLILDEHVVIAVNALRGSDWGMDGPWSPEQYGDYLGYAAEWAERWRKGTATDLVERTLSAAGQALGSHYTR
ncbi:hypothetical protein [Allokutzneria sp. NRRL B-24872]|uniref:8-oxoguanine DNA glycosylase OGG fold protein n=1 Tax=Allokutzneria sp. NRRL B-24872 TaxID=1137961 RepID=UPI000A395C96|nr:hypothetical protein [Allokutzneria sp. NRRL B-24872]